VLSTKLRPKTLMRRLVLAIRAWLAMCSQRTAARFVSAQISALISKARQRLEGAGGAEATGVNLKLWWIRKFPEFETLTSDVVRCHLVLGVLLNSGVSWHYPKVWQTECSFAWSLGIIVPIPRQSFYLVVAILVTRVITTYQKWFFNDIHIGFCFTLSFQRCSDGIPCVTFTLCQVYPRPWKTTVESWRSWRRGPGL
jgi:hypothetical protein